MSSFIPGSSEYKAFQEGFTKGLDDPIPKTEDQLRVEGAFKYDYGTPEYFAWLDGYYSDSE